MYFTIHEAQKLLPRVRKILLSAVQLRQMLHLAVSVDIEYTDEIEDQRFDTTFNKEFHRLSYEFYTQLELLETLGVVVRDIDIGLIDFLSVHENREICLCFRLGEKKITHWHECTEGFTGRRPIADLKQRSSYSREKNI